jgi:signal peptidase I
MKSAFSFIWELLKIIFIALVIVVPIRYFIFQPFLVQGPSMEPSFDSGDYLIVDEISYKFREPQRGEVIVFHYPFDPSQRFIKRIIGLPGETVEIKGGKVTVYNKEGALVLDESEYLYPALGTQGNFRVSLADDEYFVLGDNRPISADSRRWGTLPRKNIIGRVFLRLWPLTSVARAEIPHY